MALLWAMLGSALIGGLSLTVLNLADDFPPSGDKLMAALLVGPLMMAGFSLFVVVPCTLLFGLPAALLVRRFSLRRWPALVLCLSLALLAQISAGLYLWDGDVDAVLFLVTTPFAISAAGVLWWRLSPPA